MKDGKCPKCNSMNVFQRDRGFSYGGETLKVVDSKIDDSSRTSRPATFTSYVCVDCGYFENYITDKNGLEAIQKIWSKVS